jgi:uncharacterized protein (TIGR03118 family)
MIGTTPNLLVVTPSFPARSADDLIRMAREKPLHRLIQHGQLNSPWGVALAPARFGALANQLLIGNFGDGQINAYNPTTGEFVDKMRTPHGQAIVIDGLWSLRVGSNRAGSANFGPDTVFFTAGPNGEQDGLFGAFTSSP